ncbi:unnamed protein product [Auanema sp. JU1783]|nr:unnamed protein product [Auanema sp. JU1783]
MMGGGGGLVPPALLEESRVPKFYLDAIVACGASNSTMSPHTALVYNLMVRSGLQRSELSYVWSAVNRTLPGQLTRPEFFSCLALIALAQKGESLAALSSMSQLPIPTLQAAQGNTPQLSAPIVNVSSRNPPVNNTPKLPSKTSFLPTALLPKKFHLSSNNSASNTPVSNNSPTDLLGDIFPNTSTKTASINLTPESQRKTSSSSTVDTSDPSTSEKTSQASPNYDFHNWNGEPCVEEATVQTAAGDTPVRVLRAEQVEALESIILAISSRFKEYDLLFKTRSSDIVKEVFETERGDRYFRSLFHAHLILKRATESLCDVASPYISNIIKDCERIWKTIDTYIGSSLRLEESEKELGNIICGVCYQSTCSPVEFAGRSYHIDCANLWVNSVRPVLP